MDSDVQHAIDDIDPADADMGWAVVRGALVGTVGGFVATTLIALIAGTGFGVALAVAVWPAFVGGPFFGGVIAVGRLMHREERRAAADRRTSRTGAPVPAPRGAIAA